MLIPCWVYFIHCINHRQLSSMTIINSILNFRKLAIKFFVCWERISKIIWRAGQKKESIFKRGTEQKENDGTNSTEEKNTWEYANISTIPIGMGRKAKLATPTTLFSGKAHTEPREELHFDLLDFISVLWTRTYWEKGH